MPFHKIVVGLALTMIAIAWLGCSSMTIKHDYDPKLDFSEYQTYSWLNKNTASKGSAFGGSPLNYERAQKALNEELQNGGYKQDDEDPDFLVAMYGGVQGGINIQSMGYGYGYLRYWGVPQMEMQRYSEGTLIIDLVDSETEKLVWRGWASDALEPSNDPVGYIYKVVHKIMKNWPPDKT
jgi:hypothetical protein